MVPDIHYSARKHGTERDSLPSRNANRCDILDWPEKDQEVAQSTLSIIEEVYDLDIAASLFYGGEIFECFPVYVHWTVPSVRLEIHGCYRVCV